MSWSTSCLERWRDRFEAPEWDDLVRCLSALDPCFPLASMGNLPHGDLPRAGGTCAEEAYTRLQRFVREDPRGDATPGSAEAPARQPPAIAAPSGRTASKRSAFLEKAAVLSAAEAL